MHIPSAMLHGAICPVTVAVGAAGVGAALYVARKVDVKPSAAKFAAVTAMIFALQTLNYQVQSGTSGHLLGGILAVALLGVPWAVLSVSIVLAVQAVFFNDGGVSALGANVINMGLIGTGVAGILLNFLQSRNVSKTAVLAMASMVSVVAAAAACSVELALSGLAPLSKVLTAMLSVHAFIGAGEAALTVALVAVLTADVRKWVTLKDPVVGAALMVTAAAFLMSPFASHLPDGLETVCRSLIFA
ncbi:MAG: energy-coupling factor ABC transporter permease [Candidatus Omnitrophota bacterium]